MDFICRKVFICSWLVLYARVVLMDALPTNTTSVEIVVWWYYYGMKWRNHGQWACTHWNLLSFYEMLMLGVRTLQHILASAATATVGSNELLSAYFCSKAIEKKPFTVRCFFLGLPHIFLWTGGSFYTLYARVSLPILKQIRWKICEH